MLLKTSAELAMAWAMLMEGRWPQYYKNKRAVLSDLFFLGGVGDEESVERKRAARIAVVAVQVFDDLSRHSSPEKARAFIEALAKEAKP